MKNIFIKIIKWLKTDISDKNNLTFSEDQMDRMW